MGRFEAWLKICCSSQPNQCFSPMRSLTTRTTPTVIWARKGPYRWMRLFWGLCEKTHTNVHQDARTLVSLFVPFLFGTFFPPLLLQSHHFCGRTQGPLWRRPPAGCAWARAENVTDWVSFFTATTAVPCHFAVQYGEGRLQPSQKWDSNSPSFFLMHCNGLHYHFLEPFSTRLCLKQNIH